MKKKTAILREINNATDLLSGKNIFDENFPISPYSKFKDNVWILESGDNIRLNHISYSSKSINWDKYTLGASGKKIKFPCPTNIINSIKVITAIYICYPDLVNISVVRSKSRKSNTVSRVAGILSNFFGYLCFKNEYITDFNEISFSHIKDALNSYKLNLDRLNPYLMMMTVPLIKNNLGINWSKSDIKTLPKYIGPKKTKDKSLPIGLFEFFSFKASEIMRIYSLIENLELKWTSYPEVVSNYKIDENFVLYVKTACHIIIMSYTGMRYSELISLKTNCLKKINDNWFLQGTLIKGKSASLESDKDYWLSGAEIINDAVKILEYINKNDPDLDANPFLFSIRTRVKDHKSKPMCSPSLRTKINQFLNYIDTDKQYINTHISPHMFRHSYVEHMQMANVGLPYITMALKHQYQSISLTPSDITSGYGNYHHNINANTSFKFNLLKEIYSPGNTSIKIRAEEDIISFQGAVLSERELNKYVKQLSESNIKPILTGVGLCTRNWLDNESLRTDPPLCLKDHECSTDCESNIITKLLLPNFYSIINDIDDKLKDPDFEYLSEHFINKREKLQKVIDLLEVS